MYYYIEGTVAHKGIDFIVIDAGGVGYKINTTDSAISKISPGEKKKIYTYLNVREDALDLYGFLSEEELNLFKLLISVSGIGPKVGLGILSSISPSEFALAVVTGNIKAITKAPGVGPKVAQRIVLELKDKMKKAEIAEMPQDYGAFTDSSDEVVSALMVLGYTQGEAKSILSKVDTGLTVEETVKQALKLLMR
ncbi:MAG: Holliday junction branch migration protein RuvA [Clostridia bacterium]|nr:Holliday junction branch migration protein RuvA [Clostridia bacterium]